MDDFEIGDIAFCNRGTDAYPVVIASKPFWYASRLAECAELHYYITTNAGPGFDKANRLHKEQYD